jgi:hypothetical protein
MVTYNINHSNIQYYTTSIIYIRHTTAVNWTRDGLITLFINIKCLFQRTILNIMLEIQPETEGQLMMLDIPNLVCVVYILLIIVWDWIICNVNINWLLFWSCDGHDYPHWFLCLYVAQKLQKMKNKNKQHQPKNEKHKNQIPPIEPKNQIQKKPILQSQNEHEKHDRTHHQPHEQREQTHEQLNRNRCSIKVTRRKRKRPTYGMGPMSKRRGMFGTVRKLQYDTYTTA